MNQGIGTTGKFFLRKIIPKKPCAKSVKVAQGQTRQGPRLEDFLRVSPNSIFQKAHGGPHVYPQGGKLTQANSFLQKIPCIIYAIAGKNLVREKEKNRSVLVGRLVQAMLVHSVHFRILVGGSWRLHHGKIFHLESRRFAQRGKACLHLCQFGLATVHAQNHFF